MRADDAEEAAGDEAEPAERRRSAGSSRFLAVAGAPRLPWRKYFNTAMVPITLSRP
jgi:hypothetical protein